MGKILIIEDDPLVTRMYQKTLEFAGLEVTSVDNGLAGLQKTRELKPNLVFLDIMMPKMDGIEVLERIKADPEIMNTPVIMLTNLSDAQTAEDAIKKGALAYMVKSKYKPKEVAAKAKEVVENHMKQTQVVEQVQSQPVTPSVPVPPESQPQLPQEISPSQSQKLTPSPIPQDIQKPEENQ